MFGSVRLQADVDQLLIASSARTPDRMPISQVARLITPAATHDRIIITSLGVGIGIRRSLKIRYVVEGQPSSTSVTMMMSTARIMNATPPYEPATWLGLSAVKRG